MPILSSKRQITLPKDLCDKLQVHPGDDLDILEHNGQITVLKKIKGSSAAVLEHLRPDRRFSDAESRDEGLLSPRRLVKQRRAR
ncbi:MAG TPA: AbrB/MazE/SpoVT family DNA-binding domain-containing protein, partial [Casimicrobiaceae bacterium]|jgi:AbrB family looped-hinge helix DNA binding protein